MYAENIITWFKNVCVDNQSKSDTGLYHLTHFKLESIQVKSMQNAWIALFSDAKNLQSILKCAQTYPRTTSRFMLVVKGLVFYVQRRFVVCKEMWVNNRSKIM